MLYKKIAILSLLFIGAHTYSAKKEPASRQVIELHNMADIQTAINTHDYLVIDFFAPWCGPCKHLAPVLTQLATEYPRIQFAKVNTDKVRGTGVQSLPTIKFFKKKTPQAVHTKVGAGPRVKDEIVSLIKTHFK